MFVALRPKAALGHAASHLGHAVAATAATAATAAVAAAWRKPRLALASLAAVLALPPARQEGILRPLAAVARAGGRWDGGEEEAVKEAVAAGAAADGEPSGRGGRGGGTTIWQAFRPGVEELRAAERVFTATERHRVAYVSSAERIDHAPRLGLPEVCLIGRSNVGKSSLLRALLCLVPDIDIRISKTPGHTRKLHFYRVGQALTLLDAPGYGYRAPADYIPMVKGYLAQSPDLCRVVLLMDGVAGVQTIDRQTLALLEQLDVAYAVVLTKVDRASRRQLLENVLAVQRAIGGSGAACYPHVFLTSARSFVGVHVLRCFLAHATGNEPRETPRPPSSSFPSPPPPPAHQAR
ncbi:GTP-binding protein 8 isoform X2 [Petromyzon marinus]|uniref:GTP-binding protein 8 isoform X2 n=1 Tax=Petromyzon marinus TaxID=7757 RepID=UPI003F711C72